MREMRTGMPFGYIHARKGRRDDRAGTCGKLHRLRALRGRMSDGLRVAQRIPAGENAYDRLQPNAYAGAGDVADQVTPFQPDIDLEARTQGDAGQDRGGRSFFTWTAATPSSVK